jgi:alginate O-acetyltransferase complex protein AlgJ
MTQHSTKTSPEEWFAGTSMLVVMVIGFWQAFISLGSPGVQAIPFTLNDFREGRTTGSLSTQLDKNLPLRGELIAWANAGRYLLTRGAGDQVRVGRGEWLFSVEELQFYPNALAHQKDRLAMVAQAAKTLKTQGVTLVVALVPDKARAYAQQLSGGRYPDWNASRYQVALDTLRSEKVEVVDLLPALTPSLADAPLYYRTDTHWSQLGAQRAATAVAQQVKSVGGSLPPVSFVTNPSGLVVQRPGDLIRMMNLNDMPNWTRPRPDSEITEITNKTELAQPAGLFDTVSVPVVLVGTSYSLRANFHGYLQQVLGTEVLNVARDGGGFIQSAKDYLVNESFQTAKPQVIVWELPERMLSAPLSDAEKQGLPL